MVILGICCKIKALKQESTLHGFCRKMNEVSGSLSARRCVMPWRTSANVTKLEGTSDLFRSHICKLDNGKKRGGSICFKDLCQLPFLPA